MVATKSVLTPNLIRSRSLSGGRKRRVRRVVPSGPPVPMKSKPLSVRKPFTTSRTVSSIASFPLLYLSIQVELSSRKISPNIALCSSVVSFLPSVGRFEWQKSDAPSPSIFECLGVWRRRPSVSRATSAILIISPLSASNSLICPGGAEGGTNDKL